MASTINASSSGSGGLISTGDASGVLQLQSNGTVALSVSGSTTTLNGNMVVNNQISSSGDLIIDAVFSTIFKKSGATNLTINQNGIIIGTANAGIQFANSSALTNSTLNDYETGGWTPTFTDSNGHNATSYYYQFGTYVKIGRLVWVNCTISILTLGALNGQVKITGLPFTSSYQSNPNEAYQVACASFPSPTGSSYPGMTFADLESNANNFVTIWYVGANGWTAQNANVYSGGQQLHFNMCYFANF